MKKNERVLIRNLGLLLMIPLKSLISWAQQNIKGKVVDSEGLPLQGATVVVQGTAIGVITNNEGTYTINAPSVFVCRYAKCC